MRLHYFAQRKSCTEIVAIIAQRLLNAFPDSLQTGKMNHTIKIILIKNPVHCAGIGNICLKYRNRTPDNPLNAANSFGTAVDIIIDNNRVMPGFTQFHTGMGADIAGSAGQKYIHEFPPK